MRERPPADGVPVGRPLVVGAGAAGLAVAVVLARQGIGCDVVEREGSVGAAWAGRYDALTLHTVRWLSGLPHGPIPRRYGRWVARDDVVSHLREYAHRHGLEPELGVEVTRLDRDAGTWRVTMSAGTRRAPAVVLATSASNSPFLPAWAAHPPLPLEHSADYRNPGPYLGRRVLVVGAGNSGSEIAVDLARAGIDVAVSVRRPPDILRREMLGVPSQVFGVALSRAPERVMNPLGAVLRRLTVPDLTPWGLPIPPGAAYTRYLSRRVIPILDHGFIREVRAGRIRIVPAVDSLTATGALLLDSSAIAVDAVICATGYRPALEPLVGHLGVLEPSGIPRVHGPHTLPGAPDLYFAGISVELSGQLRAVGIEARAVGAAIARSNRPAQATPMLATTHEGGR